MDLHLTDFVNYRQKKLARLTLESFDKMELSP